MRRTGSDGSRRGSVLLIALVLSSVVIVLCAGLVRTVQHANRGQGVATDAREAFNVAEAGLAEAFAGLTRARSGSVGSPALPARFGDGLFWVEARDLGSDMVELEATGMVGTGRATLELHVRRASDLIGALGFFSGTDLSLPAGVFVDGYDSRQGTYDQQFANGATAGMGRVGSNGDIAVQGGVEGAFVDGDATPGPSGSVFTEGERSVTGSTDPRGSDAILPTLEASEGASEGSLVYGEQVPMIVPSGDQSFASIEIGAGSEVVLTGPSTVTVQRVYAALDSRLLLDTSGGPVDLVVTEKATFEPLSRLETASTDPTQATILVSATDDLQGPAVTIDADSQFHGSLVAPNATVSIGSEFEIFGAVAAQTLSLAPGARLHFDHALADPELMGADRPRVVSWRVIDVPLEVNNRALSPFELLGVERDTLPAPAAAHEDQWLELEYVDANGAARSFSGMESGMDWSTVASVESAQRDGEEVFHVQSILGASAAQDAASASWNDLLSDPMASSSDLKSALLADSPLPGNSINGVISSGKLAGSELKEVLGAQGGLSDSTLKQLFKKDPLSSADLKDVLLEESPLSSKALADLLADPSNLEAGDLAVVLAAQ